MAVIIGSKPGTVTTSQAVFYTAANPAIVSGCSVTNKTAAPVVVSVFRSTGVASKSIVYNTSIPAGTTLVVAGGGTPKVNIEAGDKIEAIVVSPVGATCDIIVSYVEFA